MRFSGFIFDFDGLIVDTEMPRYIAWREEYERHGQTLTIRDWWIAIGTGPAVFDPARQLSELTGNKITPDEILKVVDARSYELMEEVDLLPGVEAFIKQANKLGMPMAVASSSSADWVIGHLDRFGLLPNFQSVVTTENVQHVKPEPDLYQLALKNLGLSNGTVLAFEDSPNGIKAAKAAALHCLAIPNLITREMDLQQADKIYDSFFDFHPDSDFDI